MENILEKKELKKQGFLSEDVNIVVAWWLSLVSLKILERYIDSFKKQLILITFYFPFSEQ